jgi:hypothetical protein
MYFHNEVLQLCQLENAEEVGICIRSDEISVRIFYPDRLVSFKRHRNADVACLEASRVSTLDDVNTGPAFRQGAMIVDTVVAVAGFYNVAAASCGVVVQELST